MAISDMIADSTVAAVISDPRLPDNPIIECNTAFEALTGYAREEVIGRNCRFLTGAGTEPRLVEALRAGIRERRPVMVEILNYRKDGHPFRNAVMVAPIFDSEGELLYFLGSQMQIPDEPDESRAAAARVKVEGLSPRQRAVLLAMAKGQLNKQIAHALALSERTVKMHRAAMLRALGAQTTADAVRVAIEAGF
ncbi:PAS domain-containing protein [Gluconacetobacter diazotrophicus]|uniref:PAS domain-containing protein n=2 Tax=Gluconacetobacter diazotrophicus TaxID=33996 RepID=A0A7W4I7L3_GLUDI|nr:PAS domain-containing protein [Gluconacetobacter diazotrophicus]